MSYFVQGPIPTPAEQAARFAATVLGDKAPTAPRRASPRQYIVLHWLAEGGRLLATEGFTRWHAWTALPSPAQRDSARPDVPPATFTALLGREWIAFERINTHTLPESFVYQITDAGRAALAASKQ